MIDLRAARGDDIEVLKRALFEAVSWNPERELPPYEFVIAHPELARYHEGWGRRGDLAVIAEHEGEAVGASLCRLFTADDHGHGYVDDDTPELGGRGVGRPPRRGHRLSAHDSDRGRRPWRRLRTDQPLCGH